MTGGLLHVLAEQLVDPFLEGDHVTRLHPSAGDVVLAPVEQDVPVVDDLPGRPDGPADAQAAQDVIEPQLEDLHQRAGGVALALLGLVEEEPELLFQHAVIVTQLLLLDQADAVLGVAATAVAVHAGEVEFLAGVLRDVGDRGPDAAGEADLRSGITTHGGNQLSTGAKGARLRTCAAAVLFISPRAPSPGARPTYDAFRAGRMVLRHAAARACSAGQSARRARE